MKRRSSPVVAEHDEDGDGERDPDHAPRELTGREVRGVRRARAFEIETVDHREPEAVERECRGKEHGVGGARPSPHGAVPGDREARGTEAVEPHVRGETSGRAEADERVPPNRERDGEDQKVSLRASTAPNANVGDRRHYVAPFNPSTTARASLRDPVWIAPRMRSCSYGCSDVSLTPVSSTTVEKSRGPRLCGISPIDRDVSVEFADVVPRLGPRVGREGGHRDHEERRDGKRPGSNALPQAHRPASRLVVGVRGGERRGPRGRVLARPRPRLTRTARGRGGRADDLGGVRRATLARRLVDVDDVGHDARDVVRRPAGERERHQLIGAFRDVGDRFERLLKVRLADDRAEPVRAQEPPVAGLDLPRGDVNGHVGVDVAEDAQQHGSLRVVLRVGRAEASRVDQVLDEGVVGRHLLEHTVPEQVRARVADVRHRDGVARPKQSRHRRSEPAEFGVVAGAAHDLRVGPRDRRLERLERLILPERLGVESGERADRDRGRDVPAGGTAHSVRDDEEVRTGVRGVLIVLADEPDIRARGVGRVQGTRSRPHLKGGRAQLEA